MRQQMIALVDCVSFYANVERQFHAALENRPIIVLSNNDGNIVSLSPEARALGFKRGMAYHQCRRLIQEHRVAVFSSNFALYQDLSDRIMALLGDFALVHDGVRQQERYSIDECFLDVSHVPVERLLDYALRMQETALQATGIPVRIGIAPTKILAKVAAEIAKREPARDNVMSLADLSEQELDRILETLAVEDLRSIGKRRAQILEAQEIFTAEILKYTPPSRARYLLGVAGERIVYELRGLSCIPLEMMPIQRDGQIF